MPKAKPVSLFPLTFDEAITALIRVDPNSVELVNKRTIKRENIKTKAIRKGK